MSAKTQLFAINTAGETVLLQLSEDSPVKMNLSIAELNPFSPASYYSQTFRIPGQGTNGKFFEDVYSVNGSTFNAGVAAQAWIMTDGFLFSVGNLNLVAVYTNEKFGSIEYEVFFLGDTSDLASQIGDDYMSSIDTSELNHSLTYANVTGSWGASGGTTGGLKNGNVLYPLIEWGYNYDNNNYPTDTTLSIGYPKGSTGERGGSFTSATGGLKLEQMKPSIRVKWLFDKIFSDAGYTYTSEFLDSTLFKSMYFISDSEERTEFDIRSGLCTVTLDAQQITRGTTERLEFDNRLNDPDNAFNPVAHEFVAPTTGNYTITISGTCELDVEQDLKVRAAFYVRFLKNGNLINSPTLLFTPVPTGGGTYTTDWTYTYTGALTAGDKVYVEIQNTSFSVSYALFIDNKFQVTSGPDQVNLASFLPPQGTLKKVDFIKGIIQMFNLVFEPSRTVQKSFNIIPWVDWIYGGSQRDWTRLLDGSTDVKLIPAFTDQQRIVLFGGKEDEDLQNVVYQEQYKRDYLWREIDSQIKLVKGTQEMKIPFAATPLQSIPSKTTPQPTWILPTCAKLEPGEPGTPGAGKVQPIQPEPRILFYNGLRANPVNWYLDTTVGGTAATAQTSYPLVSPYSSFPPSTFIELDLNFQSKAPLWDRTVYQEIPANDLYTRYWREYLNWIYDPYNRKLEGIFRLDPYDVQTLRFNDKIWVKDSWFFVTKIQDYPVGDVALTRVEMIKVPTSAIPPKVTPATGPTEGSTCRSIAFCFDNSLTGEGSTYTYVDCSGNLQQLTLAPQTCSSVCALWPLVNPLPTPPSGTWTAIPDGDCPGGIYATAGAFFEIELGGTGNTFATSTGLTLKAATGGTAGTYVPLQFYSLSGNDNLNMFYNIPFDYGVQATLTWPTNAPGAAMASQSVVLKVNGATVANESRTTTYQPLTATFPNGVTGASYLIDALNTF